ncbi:LytR/AlgR family response regulator transcription factor [Hyunsoonleella ulvae]|uniref:LytR/AlgR family response regulator transcription factor n=1 Tax=Hyunsoonleella ulvae TaxID=2799948 RepID=UPI00193A7D47|nr:LytTR family DNA-binding domain-containing protein [Hyunsoonleella ulvae]
MIQSIIIDDQFDGREALRLQLEKYCPEVNVLGTCENIQEGMKAIQLHRPDLVFLDIQMPNGSGFDLLVQIKEIDFEIIFVTAYSQYAIQAIKFSALDYLLKPIESTELIQAISKVKERKDHKNLIYKYDAMLKNMRSAPGKIERLAISDMEGILMLDTAKIIYCAAEGSYSRIYLTGNKTHLFSKKLKEFEIMLGESGFCRVHHASLINIKHVNQYVKGEGGYVILTEGHHVNISRRRREAFLSQLNKI